MVYNVFGSQTANYPISGPGTLAKVGPGTLILSGSNTYTGNTFLTSGTIAINTGVPSSSVVMSSNTTLDVSGASGGTVALGSLADASGSPTGHQVLLGGNTLNTGLDNTNTTFSGAISDGGNGGSLIKDGAGTFIMAGANTYSGGTTVNSGVLTFLNRAAQPVSGMTNVAAGATLGLGVGPSANLFGSADLDNLFLGTLSNVTSDPNSNVGIDTTAGNFTYASNIPATTMGLTKLGPNTLTLTGANSYTGQTTVSGGTLQLGDGTAGHDGVALTGNILNNAALVYNLNGSQTYAGTINGNGSLTKTGIGTLTLSNNNNYSGPTVINGGTLMLAKAGGTGVGYANLLTGLQAYYPFNGNGYDASGNGLNLNLVGGAGFAPGLIGQALNVQQYFQGAQRPGDDPVFDFGSGNFAIQVWVNFNSTANVQTLIEKFSGETGPGWSLSKLADNSVQFYADFGALFLNSAPLSIPTGTWQDITVVRSSDNFDMFFDNQLVATTTYSNPISASPNPLLIGERNAQDGRDFHVDGRIDEVAIWTRALSSTEIATLYNNGNGFVINNINILPASTALAVATDSTLDLNGVSQQVATLSDYAPGNVGKIINSNSGTAVLTVSPTGGSATFSGMIQGGGTLGTISLVMSGSGTQVLAGSLLGPGSLTVNAGTLILSGSDSYTGGTTVNAGTLIAASGAALPDGTSLAVGAGGVLIFDPAQAASSVAVSAGAVAVPEPSTIALLGVGLLAMSVRHWRRKRNRSRAVKHHGGPGTRRLASGGKD